MGYTTEFHGNFTFNKPVEDWLMDYINKFSETRRMKRDPEKIKEMFPDWEAHCFNGDLGVDGCYFVGGDGFRGQGEDKSIINYNRPPYGQPGLWCQWVINGNYYLEWDEGEKFYEYVEWLEYLIEHFFAPLGYILNGDVEFQGEDYDDFGTIHVDGNVVEVQYGIRISSMADMSTEDMIAELEKRGYKVTL